MHVENMQVSKHEGSMVMHTLDNSIVKWSGTGSKASQARLQDKQSGARRSIVYAVYAHGLAR
jgi:hypothetical protein